MYSWHPPRRCSGSRAPGKVVLLISLVGLAASVFPTSAKLDRSNKSSSSTRNGTSTQKLKSVPKGACISQGGRFLPFPDHGKKPKRRKSPKGKADDLSFCRVYKDSTCCGRLNSDAALFSLRMLQIGAEPTEECVRIWEALECAVCHPAVGTQPGPPAICSSFCDRVFSACGNAFFATDPIDKVFLPCSSRDTLCSRGFEWANTSTDFCRLAGYDVVQEHSLLASQRYCFDGSLIEPRKGSDGQKSTGKKGQDAAGSSDGWWEQWFGEDGGAFLGSNVWWAVAGLVLTAAAGLWRWRALRAKRKRAAVLASRQLAEARAKQQALHAYAVQKSAKLTSATKKKQAP